MRRAYVDTRLGQIHFATSGEGPPLVLLPQGGRSWTMFADLACSLDREFRSIAIDYPGSGGSDAIPEPVTFETIAAAIVDLLDALGIERALVYGIHTGNKIAAALAANWSSRVMGVVLAGQSHSIVPSNERRGQTVGRTRRKLLGAEDAREQALVHWADVFSVVSGAWWHEDLMRDIANPARRAQAMRKAIDEIGSAQSMPSLYRANFAFDLAGAYARIEVPTLVLEIATPAEDRTIGRQGAAVQALVKGAHVETLEASDYHGITLENQTGQLAPILRRFFQTVMASASSVSPESEGVRNART
jgi:pimeloyl-ACP methyl ester carboxylesterase